MKLPIIFQKRPFTVFIPRKQCYLSLGSFGQIEKCDLKNRGSKTLRCNNEVVCIIIVG